MSSDPEQEYFSDGISEELLNLLAQIPELRVISRSSAFSFKGSELDTPTIAEQLHVDHILEGSVRKADNNVRITAQLIDARSDAHLWSATYDRALGDIFAIQTEIAIAVVDALKVELLGHTTPPRQVDPEAFALYLQAMYLGNRGKADTYQKGLELLKRALAISPEYAKAWRGLATNYINQVGIGIRDVDEGYALASEAASQALALDPDDALAHDTLGWIAMTYDRDLAAAARHFEKALSLERTNLTVILDSGELLLKLGRLDEAILLWEYVSVRDPVNPTSHSNLGTAYVWAGRFDEAIASLHTALTLSPGRFRAHYRIGEALLQKGDAEGALREMMNESMEGFRLIGQAMAYHALGQESEADAALAQLIDGYEEAAAYNIAYVCAFREESDHAFSWLNKAVQFNDPGLLNIAVNSLFASLYDDPRWLPFLQSIGKSPEQLRAIQFEVALPQ
jgi:TolB-like protein/Tfp pilus assembly protein PilF